MYAFSMAESLKGSLRWAVVDDYEIAYCQSRVAALEAVSDGSERRVLEAVRAPAIDEEDTMDVDDEGASPSRRLFCALIDGAAEARSHRSVFVGRPQLKDIKQQLDKRGFRTEFVEGVLVVNELVRVRKAGADASNVPQLVVEGGMCADYYAVRDIVYGRFQVI